MNKEVKEFLDKSSNYEVIEYINQLQQENKQLKEQLGKLSQLDDTDFWLEYNRDVWKIQNENEKLKEKIDKAIEYMNEIKYDKTDKYIPINQYNEYGILLEILKGE